METSLNLHHLFLFSQVVEYQSFSVAARSLNMTQPSVSLQIKSLERTLQIALFERSGPQLQLTDAGQVVYDAAKKILAIELNLKRALEELHSGKIGHVSVATNRPFGRYLLPKFLAQYIRTYPLADVSTQYADTERISQLVADELVDLGVVSSDGEGIDHSKLEVQTLYQDTWCLVASSNTKWADGTTGLRELLTSAPLVTSVESSTNWKQTKHILSQLQLSDRDYDVRIRLGDIESIKTMVLEGVGIALLPRSCAHNELTTGQFCDIASLSSLTFWLITKPKDHIRPTVQQFVNLLTKYFLADQR
ncbi:LysR family transcriptional regulator [Alicyclobacillus dauci]|uniref:LysR family transcriptional regulator n=1 Tax=Alicyclobacillus dauci TaxID=1475485 RepID=A0ABY6Z647_9BACL|nr:LysR family transcriptional regulator [Alicyclobacillus dauci]WAH37983.1 LysR family transcriptional regulator [Alicyclobacillus dauci]